MKGKKPTEKLVAWCCDQWRRMQPVGNYAQACEVSSPIVMRPSTCLPRCYVCGAVCKDYTEDIGKEIPEDELERIVGDILERKNEYLSKAAGDETTELIAERLKRRRTDESYTSVCMHACHGCWTIF